MAAMRVVARSMLIANADSGLRHHVAVIDGRSGGPPIPARTNVPGALALPRRSVYRWTSGTSLTPRLRDRPATLQLAFVPRVSGQNLRVEFPVSAGDQA
jgi:hypothetical protein